MTTGADGDLDVMQVCRNGHVITGRLTANPDSGRTHCDRCGATTLERCPTCGEALAGAGRVPDLTTIGSGTPPRHCHRCGAAFPWTRRPASTRPALAQLETLLSRLPLVIRQLRWRQGERPPFRVENERDLEDLVRALLPQHFTDPRPESRTPSYSPVTRTDFVLAAERIAVTVKFVRAGVGVEQLAAEWREDVGYYRQRGGCTAVVSFVYDPQGLLPAADFVKNIAAEVGQDQDVQLRCIVAS